MNEVSIQDPPAICEGRVGLEDSAHPTASISPPCSPAPP